ncbi:MAG: hypothetical protein KDA84_25315, partial [Planctomycetaceae bacterium]|nr:hypothetical protein [Planctomycetaceae bacterium]
NQLLFHKLLDEVRVWDIQQSRFTHQHKVDEIEKYEMVPQVHVDQATSQLLFYGGPDLTIYHAETGKLIDKIPLNGLTGERPLFLKDGRILFGAHPPIGGPKQITSLYPLLVCYDLPKKKVVWTQPFDTFPSPWLVAPDQSQLQVFLPGMSELNPSLPRLDPQREVSKGHFNEREVLVPTFSQMMTLDLDDGTNRVLRNYKTSIFYLGEDATYSPDGKTVAFLRCHPPEDTAVAAGTEKWATVDVVDSATWTDFRQIRLEGNDWKGLFFLPNEQSLVAWGKRGLCSWDMSDEGAQAQSIFPPTKQNPIPASAEKKQ